MPRAELIGPGHFFDHIQTALKLFICVSVKSMFRVTSIVSLETSGHTTTDHPIEQTLCLSRSTRWQTDSFGTRQFTVEIGLWLTRWGSSAKFHKLTLYYLDQVTFGVKYHAFIVAIACSARLTFNCVAIGPKLFCHLTHLQNVSYFDRDMGKTSHIASV